MTLKDLGQKARTEAKFYSDIYTKLNAKGVNVDLTERLRTVGDELFKLVTTIEGQVQLDEAITGLQESGAL